MICYHGTRNYNGGDLRPYSITEMREYIDRLLRKVGISFDEWATKGYLAHRILADLDDKKRQRIWVTDNSDTAKSYASRSPEIAWDVLQDAIDHILWGRRWRQSNTLRLCKNRNQWIDVLLGGKPIVLTVRVDNGGFNCPVDFIPESDILSVEDA